MKKAALFILTIVIIISSINYVSNIIKFKQYSTYSKSMYYKENIDYDIIFLGSSMVFFDISPLYLYNRYGLSSYNLSFAGCQYDDLFAVTQEIIKTKRPKVLVVEYRQLIFKDSNKDFIKGNLSNINDFFIRLNVYLKKYSFMQALKNSSIYYLFHNRWKEITKKDFSIDGYLRGYYSTAETLKKEKYTGNEEFKLNDNHKSMIDEYVKLTNKYNIKLILISLPTLRNDSELFFSDECIEAVSQYVKKYNIDFINLKNLENFNVDKYLLDTTHLTYSGGKNIMDRENFIPYIMKKYNLQDHRNDKKFASWHKDYLKQERMINGEELKYSKDFNAWWNYANYDNYTMLISVKGENVIKRLPNDMKDKFKSIGLTKYETSNNDDTYAAIIDNKKIFYEYIFNKQLGTNGRVNNKFNMQILSDKYNAIINISGKSQSKNQYGINFVVYDNINREVVDSIWVDPEDFNKVNR